MQQDATRSRRFHPHNASAEAGFLEAFLQFPLGLPGTEDQNEPGIINERNDRIAVNIEMDRKRPLRSLIAQFLVFRFSP